MSDNTKPASANFSQITSGQIWFRSALMAMVCFVGGGAFYKNEWWPFGNKSVFRANEQEEFATYKEDQEWAQKVQKGGYILYIRHAQREKWNDVTAFDMVELLNKADASKSSYKRAVCLTEQGQEEAKLMGEVFRLANVKIDKVVTSPSCRAWQTAQFAFGKVDQVSNALLHRTAVMKEQHEQFARETRKIVESLNPAPGTNAVITAHAGTMRFDRSILIDQNDTNSALDARDETGFVVLEKKDGRIIARHKFMSIKNFSYATLKLPLNVETAKN